jgi:RNA polymerase sigma-70 factor (ECF subfamily)
LAPDHARAPEARGPAPRSPALHHPPAIDLAALGPDAPPDQRRAALRALYDGYRQDLWTRALQILGDRDLADDVVAETLLDATTRAHQVRDAGALGAWLRRSLVRAAVEHLRREERLGARGARHAGDLDAITDPAPSWLDTTAAAENAREAARRRDRQAAAIMEFVGGLSSDDRAIVRGRLFTGRSHQQIAHDLGRTVLAVTKRWSVLRERLQRALRAAADGDDGSLYSPDE